MIGIGCDHGGYKLKEEIERYLEKEKISFIDFGAESLEAVDYPVIAEKVSKSIQKGECKQGILICRSGIGMSIAANKCNGIRATICRTVEDARMSKSHNNTNVITIGADVTKGAQAIKIIQEWMNTEFAAGRHEKRVKQLEMLENR